MSNRVKRKEVDVAATAERISDFGTRLFRKGRLGAAADCFQSAIMVYPDSYEAWQNLGAVHVERGDHDEAIDCLLNAVRLRPQDPNAHMSLAVSCRVTNRIDEALDHVRRSLHIDPDQPQALLLLAHLHLLRGDLETGFLIHERSREGDFYNRNFADRLWNGQDPSGKMILVLGEQGFGDDLQFVRYATLLHDMGARVVFGCKPPLARLFHTVPGIDAVHPFNEPPPDFHYWCPVMRLAQVFGTSSDTIPADIPYFHADPDDLDRFGLLMASHAVPTHDSGDMVSGMETRPTDGRNLRIGLCWSGASRKHDPVANRVDSRRSMTLSDLAPLSLIPGLTFYSLQVGDGSGQEPPTGMRLVDLTGHLRDFADTAALVAHLDLVITVDTSVCHLAGGLGTNVWMLSRFDGCWRWMLDREDSPWYPTMRIFRQEHPGDWAGVVRRVAASLARFRKEKRTC